MKKTILYFAIGITTFTACNQTNNQKDVANSKSDSVKTEKIIKVKSPIMANYIAIEKALAKDDSKTASEAANNLTTSIKDLNTSTFNNDQKAAFTKLKDEAIVNAKHVGEYVNDIDHQREHFKMLSENMYIMVKSVDNSQTFYKVTCPMYKNGSSWLSATNEVINPYFGNSMLTCGTVEETIN